MATKIIKWNEKVLTFNGRLISVPGTSLPSNPWPTDQLVARWTFNETLAEDTTSAYNWSCTEGTATYVSGADSDKALDITTDDKYVINNSTLTSVFQSTNSWTVSFWFKPDGIGTAGAFWKVGDQTGDAGTQIRQYIHKATNALGMERNGDGADPPFSSWGNWKHYLHTYNGSQMEVFIDNSSVSTKASTQSISTTMPYFCLHTAGNLAYGYYAIQKMYLYGKALTSNERATLYNSGTPI